MQLGQLTPKNAGGIALLAVVGVVVLYVVAKKVGGAAIDAGAGLVSGNNAITQNQTNAAGEKTTAYEGGGVLGTVGAATNSASGGVFASVGEWVGGTLYDLTHADPMAAPKVQPSIDVGGTTTAGW